MSEQIFEARSDSLQHVGRWSVTQANKTGLATPHEMGDSFLRPLKKTLWGFGSTKYAMHATLNLTEYANMCENTKHCIEQGTRISHQYSNPDAEYLRYLRFLSREIEIPTALWLDESTKNQLSEIGGRAIRHELRARDNGAESGPGL